MSRFWRHGETFQKKHWAFGMSYKFQDSWSNLKPVTAQMEWVKLSKYKWRMLELGLSSQSCLVGFEIRSVRNISQKRLVVDGEFGLWHFFFRMWCTNLQLLMGFWSLKLAWEVFIWKQLKFSVIQVLGREALEAQKNLRFHHLRRQSLVLCERDWGAQEIRKLNAGFKVLSAAEIIDDPWLSWRNIDRESVVMTPWKLLDFPKKILTVGSFSSPVKLKKWTDGEITCCNWAVFPVESIAAHFYASNSCWDLIGRPVGWNVHSFFAVVFLASSPSLCFFFRWCNYIFLRIPSVRMITTYSPMNVSSAQDLLREVRQWARHGFSGREIQVLHGGSSEGALEMDRVENWYRQSWQILRVACNAMRISQLWLE